MNRNSLIILAAITLTVVITAFAVVSKERSPTYMSDEVLLPELNERINDAVAITLVSNRYKTVLERDGDTWRIANSDGYPALFDKVRSLLISLTELRTRERKTDNPDLYHHLHVQEPSKGDSNSVQVTVTDADNNVLADLIIGKGRTSKVTNIQTGLYVRKPSAEHALLVEGRVPAAAEKTAWFDQNIVNIASERVREVVIQHPDGNRVRAYRDSPDDNFQLADLPTDRRIQSRMALNKFGSVLQEVNARDIRALEQFEFPESAIETTIHTFDGLVAEVKSAKVDDNHYANFRFRFDESLQTDAAKPVTDDEDNKIKVDQQARNLQQQLGGWVYRIPGFKYEVLTATLDDYTRKVSTD